MIDKDKLFDLHPEDVHHRELALIVQDDDGYKVFSFDTLVDHNQKREEIFLFGCLSTGIFCDVSSVTDNMLVLPWLLINNLKSKTFDELGEIAVLWDEYRYKNNLIYC